MSANPKQRALKRDLTSGSLSWNLFRLAAPLVAGSLLQALYSLVDAFWLGRWSEKALAAPGVCMPFIFVVITFAMGFGIAGTALVAQHIGAGDHRRANRAAAQTMLLLCTIVTVLAASLVLPAPHLLRLVQVPDAMLPKAAIYLRIFMLGLPFVAFNIGYGSVLRALGDTMTVVLITALSNVLNAVLDPVLIFGWAGVPALGVGGAALASLIAQFAGGVACYVCLRLGRAGLHIRLADLRPDWPLLWKTFTVGFPVALGNSSNSLGFTVFQVMINSLGITVIGAFFIGFRVIHFFNVLPRAMSMAAAPVVGQALGAGDVPLARRAVWKSAAFVALVTFPAVVFLVWQGQLVARAFIPNVEVIAETRRFFMIVPASSYFFGVLMVLMAAFYGSGHTWPAMAVSVLRLWFLRLPAAYLLGFVLGWGSLGVYVGMVFGNLVCSAVALWLFLRGGWESAVVAHGGSQRGAPEEGNGQQ